MAEIACRQKATFRHRHCALGLLIAVLSWPSVFAEDAAADKEQRARRIEIIRGHAAKHIITPAGTPDEPLVLRREPLLYWTNPTRGKGRECRLSRPFRVYVK